MEQQNNKCTGCEYLLGTCCGENQMCGYTGQAKVIPIVCPANKW